MKPTESIRTSIEKQARTAVAGEYAELLGYPLSQEEARAVIDVAETADNPRREAARAVAEATATVSAAMGTDPAEVLADAVDLLDEVMAEGAPDDEGPPRDDPPIQQARAGIFGASLAQEAGDWAGDRDADPSGPWTTYDWAREEPPEDGDGGDLADELEAWAEELIDDGGE